MKLKGVKKLDHVLMHELKSTTADSGVVYFYRDRNKASLVHVFDGEKYIETLDFVEVVNILSEED